jgi:predicted metal-dependent phosphoesterase TrpH
VADPSGAAEAARPTPEAPGPAGSAQPAPDAFVDLHCHTSASFDSLATPAAVVRAAAARGLTHLAITDHERIDGALEAREIVAETAGGPPLTILVGEEIRTREGDLIAVFLAERVEGGMSAAETVAAVREQGGLIGVPHPFDRFRGSVGAGASGGTVGGGLDELVAAADWIEAWNARILLGDGNERAADLARRLGLPGVAVSDAHTTMEVAIASTGLRGDPATPAGLLAALAAGPTLLMGRASAYVRLVTPAAKLVQRVRGRGRNLAAGTSR